MKYLFLLLLVLLALSSPVSAQSKAMDEINEKHEDGFSMVFYYSTLKMWLPEEDTELKEMIYDVEKIKFLRLDPDDVISAEETSSIISKLENQKYEEAIVIKGPTRNLLVYIREDEGIFMMGTESGETYILDIIGTIPVNKLLTLQDKIETLTKNGSLIDSFTDN
jgi:hypothetical protein